MTKEESEVRPGRAARAALQNADQSMGEITNSVAMLRTETDRARNLFGFGRRILVPPDEIHVVVGDGIHFSRLSSERRVFGQTADRSSRYWLNSLTQVIKLKTISFTVPLRGYKNEGIPALDNSNVSFRLWAHAVAKLHPDKAEIAAQRVGLDTTGLVNTIAEVGTAELIAAAATMSLQDIIANRQKLSEIAFPKVNQILSELGYDLALLTVTKLDGDAYSRLIEQAESRISKETTVATNREQLAELHDDQNRQRTEAEITAITEKKLAAERLEAEREVETATISQQESLDVRRHEMRVLQIGREKAADQTGHDAEMARVELAQQRGEAEAQKDARLARLKAEREAELRALQQERTAAIRLAESQAEAERLAVEQARQIERAAKLTEAEALRLREEELTQAERAREIALIEANQMSDALTIEAQAESKAELVRAEAEATATQQRAQAAKMRAEATRAEAAAAGLAEAEVATAQVEVAEKQVAVTRAEALAEVERQQKMKEVEIAAQKEFALLYEQAPILVDLEKLRIQFSHERELAQIRTEASLRAFEAIAPGIKVHIFGNAGQTGEIFSNLLAISHGLTAVGDEIPMIGNLVGSPGSPGSHNGHGAYADLLPKLATFTPYIRRLAADVQPRVLTSLKIADVVDRLSLLVAGQEDLVTSLNKLRQDAIFRVVGDLPVGPVLNMLGIDGENETEAETIVVEDVLPAK
ncbi:MAG: SPFH domain-containing protein [Chloroflexota bacterium]